MRALSPLQSAAPVSKSAVSRVIVTLKASFDERRQRPLDRLDEVHFEVEVALRQRGRRPPPLGAG